MAEAKKFRESKLEGPTSESLLRKRRDAVSGVEQTTTSVTDKEVEQSTDRLEAGIDKIIEPQTIEPTPEVTPEVVGEPTPIVEEAPVLEEPVMSTPDPDPIVTEPKIEEVVEPTPTPIEKIESAEDIKSKKLDIQAKEEVQVTQKQQKVNDSFNNAVQSGSLDVARKIAIQNPDMRGQFESVLRNTFKSQDNINFFKNYNGATNDEMKSAVDDGKIVIGSSQYNLLPEAQRKRFENFQKMSISKKTDFSNDNANVISLEDITRQVQDMFNFNLREKIEEQKNNPQLLKTRTELENIQNDIGKLDDSLERLEDDVRKQFNKSSTSLQNSEIAKRSKDLLRNKNSLVNQYNAKLGTYQDMKQDLNMELEISKFEDSQQREMRNTVLSMYEKRRLEMRQDQLIKFESEEKIRAEERQFQQQKDLVNFKNDLESQKVKGKWETFPDGLYFLREDGTQSKVLSGEQIGISEKGNFKAEEIKNEDGTITVIMTDLDNGTNNIATKDIFGNIVYPGGEDINGTDLRGLVNKYPGQAWAKNNNSAGVTWQATSNQLKGEWAEAGISFNQGTKRPSGEGGNYVDFPTIQDGLAAHAITLGRKKSSIQEGLAQWVGTPKRETNLAYARSLYAESGITKPISTPLNKLNDFELYSLMKVQIKRESPGLYSEMKRNGWLGDTAFNVPVKSPDPLDSEAEIQLTKEQFNQRKDIMKEFTSDEQVKAFEKALVEGKNLIVSLGQENGAGDMAAIFQFMKSLDPSSVVRESEFDAAANTAGLSTKGKVYFKKLITGDKLDNEQQRKEFKKIALQFLKNRGDSYDRKYGQSLDFYKNQLGTDAYFPKKATDDLVELLGDSTSGEQTGNFVSDYLSQNNNFNIDTGDNTLRNIFEGIGELTNN